ncbi:MAG: hypothetical protein KJN90_04295 [Gammaproteobacteria bacterium]|nr:hypothetical protein [Gammaproteobacteria bacterium]
MSDFFSNPGAMTTEQWLAVCILGFILLAILVMIHRLLAIMKMSQKQTYKPNFRRLRRYRPVRSDETAEEHSDDKQQERNTKDD